MAFPVDSVGSVSVGLVDSVELEPVDSVASVELVEPVESVESVEPVDSVELLWPSVEDSRGLWASLPSVSAMGSD